MTDVKMKRCRFCAEEIIADAIVCRYCGRDLRRRYFRKVFSLAVIAAIVVFLIAHKYEARRAVDNIIGYFRDLKESAMALKDSVKSLPGNIAAEKESREEMESLLESIRKIKEQQSG